MTLMQVGEVMASVTTLAIVLGSVLLTIVPNLITSLSKQVAFLPNRKDAYRGVTSKKESHER